MLISVLETIEIAFRTHTSYEIAHRFGPLGYKDKENFINEKYHKESLDELNNLIKKVVKVNYLLNIITKIMMVTIPIWVAIEVTPFGFLSKLYRNLSEDVKKHIAKIYYNVPYLYLESWLQTLSNVRNVCAHYGRLYNKKLTFKPRLFKEEMKQFDNGFAFAAIYIIQRLLTKDEGQRFITDLQALILEYEDSLEFSHIGFPTNWDELLSKIKNQKS